jgi:hypothetical protein
LAQLTEVADLIARRLVVQFYRPGIYAFLIGLPAEFACPNDEEPDNLSVLLMSVVGSLSSNSVLAAITQKGMSSDPEVRERVIKMVEGELRKAMEEEKKNGAHEPKTQKIDKIKFIGIP